LSSYFLFISTVEENCYMLIDSHAQVGRLWLLRLINELSA
jgi:hypothetical protein